MASYGQGILKGLSVTLKHFIATYIADVRRGGARLLPETRFAERQGLKAEGMFTVEYPDEKLAVPERFRFVPFLVVEDADHPERPGHDWCTSCGICAKVCPPQCIWIVRGEDPVSKRPIPEPEAFYIDIDICMNCGFCAEFCPFDAIKMDHDYELASYDRTSNHIHDKAKLSKPFSYWLSIAPTTAHEEAQDRGSWEHSDVVKAKNKGSGVKPIPYVPVGDPKEIIDMLRTATGKTAPDATASAEVTTAAAGPSAAEREAEVEAARIARRMEALARRRARG